MPRVTFAKNQASFIVPMRANLMHELLERGHAVASSCDGEGICGMCRIQIVEGKDNLTPICPVERALLSDADFKESYRVSCRIKILGDITIDTKYW